MLCRALLIPENNRMSRSVFCDASRVLIQISLTSVESSSRGILSISKSVGNSRLNLLAALTDLSNAGCVLSTPKKILLCLLHQVYLLKILVQKIHLFVLLREPMYHRCKARNMWLLSQDSS